MITRDEFDNLTKEQRDGIREQAKDKLADYLATRHGITNLNKNFRCPVCGHDDDAHYYPVMKGTGKPGIFCYSGKGCKNKGYDILDLIGIDKGYTDYNDKLFEAANYLGITPTGAAINQDAPARSDQGAAAAQQQRKAPNPEGIRNFVRQAAAAMPGSRGETYMTRRGFDPLFLQEMRIGYDEYFDAVVIPYNKEPDPFLDYYFMRYIVPKVDDKGKEQKAYKLSGIEPIFHADNITNSMPYVFVCEGQIDALSIEQAGGNAIALGGTGSNKLLDYLKILQDHPDHKDLKSKKTFVIALDNDTAGNAAGKKLVDDLTGAGYAAISAKDAGLYDYTEALKEYEADKMKREKEQGKTPQRIKDINELLQGDPHILTVRIERMISKPADVYRDSFSMGSFRSEYQQQRERNSSSPRISTGFNHLDEVLDGGIRPSLIFLGAITSIGKTTFVMQIADHIARSGKDVIIFALEMSRFELVSRSISRESLRIAKSLQIPQPGNALKFYEIADGQPLTKDKYSILQQAEDYYFKVIAPHIFIVEGEGDVTVESIRQQVQTHTELTGSAPVVIVDYLQLLQPPKDAIRWSDKQVVDHNTIAMKHISRDFKTPVIGVLSLNRESYNRDVDLASGKESGAIEYGCDILLGMNQEKENSNGTRSIYIDVLKNRSGMKDRRVTFEYTPAHSYFMDLSTSKFWNTKAKKTNTATKDTKKGEKNAEGKLVL